jgi:predicted anti-sigma-YlaC factor YlaD
MAMGRSRTFPILVVLSLAWFCSCSIKRVAINKVADMLSSSSGSSVFASDNDPELVADALPFAIKLYESLLAAVPGNEGLRLRTGSLCIMYANAFLQNPADMTPRQEIETREHLLARAKNLYLRGRDMLLVALRRRNPALLNQLKERKYKEATALYGQKDVPFLYWVAAGWMGAFAIDPFDMRLGLTLPQAAALMDRVRELDPGYGRGAIHVFFISYYGSLPEYMGGDLRKAREHYEKALALSVGADISPYIALATTVCVKEHNIEEFKSLLKKALEFDPDKYPDTRLANIIGQRKARWLLEHIESYFLVEELP